MKKLLQSTLATTVALALAAGAYANAQVGSAAPDFTLTDSQGKVHKLSDYADKIVVLEWTNDGCPFVKRHYNSKNMQALQENYTGKGIVWLQIASSAKGMQGNHTAAEWESIRQSQGHHSSALLLDEPGKVGRLYGAQATPHMFVIEKGIVVYNGAIDDKPQGDAASATNYVAAAIDALLAGQDIKVKTSKPYGCSMKYDS